MSEAEDDIEVPTQLIVVDESVSETVKDMDEVDKDVLLNVGGNTELHENFGLMQDSEKMGESKHPDSTEQTLAFEATSQQVNSPPPNDSITNVGGAAVVASTKSWQKASIVLPYNGELYPPENLNAAQTYVSILKIYREAVLKTEPIPNNPLQTVFKMLSPKLEDLEESRRFQLKNFDATSAYSISGGRFGNIFKQKFMDSSEVALKLFKRCLDTATIYKEVHMLIALQNKRIVKILGAFHENGTWLVMELYLGNIREYMKELTSRQKVRFGIQLLEAVDLVHSRNIIHCDIRPENVLISSKNNVVLGGFGNANLLPKGVKFIRSHSKLPGLGAKAYSDAHANDRIYSKSTDMFGVGCTLFEMDCGYPLMEYLGWPDAPTTEYIRCVKKGRLILSPFVIPDAQFLEHDGERETLLERSKRSVQFGEVLPELIQDSHRRPSSAFILENYKPFFSRSLKEVNSSFEQLDNDPLPDGWTPTPDFRVVVPSHDCSPVLTIAMDLIYWDIKMNPNTEADIPEQHFTAVQVDNLQSCIKQFLESNSFRVKKSGNDHFVAPEECTSALKAPNESRIDLENSNATPAKTAPKPTSGMSTENASKILKPSTESYTSSLVLDGSIASSQNQTLGGKAGVQALTNARKTENDTVSRKRKLAQVDSLKNPECFVSEPTSCDPTTAKPDDQKKKKKKKKKRSHKKSKQVENEHSIVNEPARELPAFKISNSTNKKEQLVAGNQYVSIELRGTPPAPTNLPDDFTPDDDWSGWFDCGKPCPYFTGDYIEIIDHMSECSFRNE